MLRREWVEVGAVKNARGGVNTLAGMLKEDPAGTVAFEQGGRGVSCMDI